MFVKWRNTLPNTDIELWPLNIVVREQSVSEIQPLICKELISRLLLCSNDGKQNKQKHISRIGRLYCTSI